MVTLAASWPRYFHDRGRITRFGRVSIGVVAGLFLVVAVSLVDWLAFLVQEVTSG